MPIGDRKGGFIRPGYDPLEVPNAPTVGTLENTGAGTSLSLSFTAPSNVGGGAISGYTAVATDSSSGATFAGTGTTSPVTISGLTQNNTYTAKAYANNAYGPSGSSAASNSAIPVFVQGQQQYISAGTYSWTAPAGVTSVSVVVVGGGAGADNGGGSAGGGGALGWKNNIPVVPGTSYTVVVGNKGNNSSPYDGAQSYFINATTVQAGGGKRSGTNGYVGDGGGNSSSPNGGGGGGAGGYSGDGSSGTGGSGGRGTTSGLTGGGAGGGGVGILGEGSSGTNYGSSATEGAFMPGGGGGSGGGGGGSTTNSTYNGGYSSMPGGSGGSYGGGAGAGYNSGAGNARAGAVRIIWGPNRAFPSTNTGNL